MSQRLRPEDDSKVLRKYLDDIARCSGRENVLWHSHAVHALLWEKANNNAALRFEDAMDFSKACIQ